jgi:hypothetical protein
VTPTGPALALVPGPDHGPGTGANTGPDDHSYVPPPDIFDPPPLDAARAAFIRAKDGYLIVRDNGPDLPPDLLTATSVDPHAYTAWLDHIWPAAGCTRPIRLTGNIHHIDPGTGEVTSTVATSGLPDAIIYKACGNRRTSVCPSCAETYRRDAFQLIRAGLIGGKGIPDDVATHPAVFATFTAPSFGPVHARPIRRHTCVDKTRCTCRPQPCHARRDAENCPHGQLLACITRHRSGDPKLGQPLCRDCYDHQAHVVWNNTAGELWRRTKQAIERHLAQLARHRGIPFHRVPCGNGRYRLVSPVRVSHGKAAEYQARGAVHFHALLRLDGLDPRDPDLLAPPPDGLTATDLEAAIRHAAASITWQTPAHPASPGGHGWVIGWGSQLDVQPITMSATGTITDLMAASYLAKYSTKGTEVTGHTSTRLTPATVGLYAKANGTHTQRLIHACWMLGGHRDYASLQRWAHMLGFGGHFLTKARHYSVTFGELRAARIFYRRNHDHGPEHQPIRAVDHTDDDNTTLIVGHLSYAGTGWKTTGDALLASTAADQARKRHQAGREDTSTEIDQPDSGQQAA